MLLVLLHMLILLDLPLTGLHCFVHFLASSAKVGCSFAFVSEQAVQVDCFISPACADRLNVILFFSASGCEHRLLLFSLLAASVFFP